jgi:hypothetical protein
MKKMVKTSIVLMLLLAAPAMAQPPYVLSGEKDVLSFQTEKGKRMVICIGVAEAESRYLVYRFGKRDAVEFEYPAGREHSFDKFVYSYYLRGGGPGNEGLDLNYLTFENEGTKYTIYQEYYAESGETSAGIRVLPKGKTREVDIKAKAETIKGSLLPFRTDDSVKKVKMVD